MDAQMDVKLEQLAQLVEKFCAGASEVTQRIVIILSDVVLILFAVVAGIRDWGHQCDENLRTYGFMCVMLCTFDVVWEVVRCSTESSLDRLRSDFTPGGAPNLAGCNEEGLLHDSPFAEGVMGSPGAGPPALSPEKTPGSRGSITSGAAGHGIRKEKAMRKKRTNDLHFWSLVFTASVAIVFSFFSAHDEECAENMPSLYSYIHTFTYVYICRLGIIILQGCCRTVKDYEDAALSAGGLAGDSTPGPGAVQMRGLVL